MPVIRLSREDLQRDLLPPFRAAIAADVDAIMVSHVEIPALDPDHPVALSDKVVQQLLRQDLGYDGLVCSDDLLMGAVIKNSSPSQAAILAVKAGTDLLMVSNPAEVPAMHQALVQAVRAGQLEADRVDAAVRRILGKKLQRDLIASADALRQNKGLASLHQATQQGDAIVKPLDAREEASK
jgi:beta-glucosidase-like glycosyl hydrolase